MNNKAKENVSIEKDTKLKNLKTLSKNKLETIIGGPETSRGTTTQVGN